MHFDARALLTHVVHHTPNECPGVIDRQRGALTDFAEVIEIIGPLLAVLELECEYRSLAVFPFGLLGDTQPFSALGKDLCIRVRRLVRLSRSDRNGGKSA